MEGADDERRTGASGDSDGVVGDRDEARTGGIVVAKPGGGEIEIAERYAVLEEAAFKQEGVFGKFEPADLGAREREGAEKRADETRAGDDGGQGEATGEKVNGCESRRGGCDGEGEGLVPVMAAGGGGEGEGGGLHGAGC